MTEEELKKMMLFPAQAGVILGIFTTPFPYISVPRASGGDPKINGKTPFSVDCSPRKRG